MFPIIYDGLLDHGLNSRPLHGRVKAFGKFMALFVTQQLIWYRTLQWLGSQQYTALWSRSISGWYGEGLDLAPAFCQSGGQLSDVIVIMR